MKRAAITIDRALHSLRTAADMGLILRSLLSAGLLGWALVLAYYLEQVELTPGARPVLAVLLVVAFHVRVRAAVQVAGALVASRLPDAMIPAAPQALDVARTTNVVLFGHLALCVLPVAVTYLDPRLVPLAFLPFVLRGATVGTWLARAAAAPEGGVAAIRRARRDLRGARLQGLLVEGMLFAGTAALAVNLLTATVAAFAVARSVFGVDAVAWRAVFADPFAWLVAFVAAAAVLDPLRAAVSAVVYVSARARREGFDLDVALQRVLAPRGAALLVAVLVFTAGHARAEPATVSSVEGRDEAVDRAVQEALARPEFTETVRPETYGLLDRLLRWFRELEPSKLPPRVQRPALPAPPPWTMPAAAVALALIVVALALGRRPERSTSDDAASDPTDPRDRPAEDHLAAASRLAAEGAHREALRALYLATLVALDARGLIAFDRCRTNRHYLRGMREGAARDDFRSFTELFDRTWYGERAASEREYLDGRALAERLCRAPEAEA